MVVNELKPLYESKTFWAGTAFIVMGIIDAYTGGTITTDSIIKFLTGAGFIGLRDALRKM